MEFKALELQPKDPVSAAVVATLSPARRSSSPVAGALQAVPSDTVVGKWTANRKAGAQYHELAKDGAFTWAFTRGVREARVKGVYTVEGNVLALEPDTGGVMLAELTASQPGSLQFKMIGAAANDPGLQFKSTAAN